jgi:hypothetical protein
MPSVDPVKTADTSSETMADWSQGGLANGFVSSGPDPNESSPHQCFDWYYRRAAFTYTTSPAGIVSGPSRPPAAKAVHPVRRGRRQTHEDGIYYPL